MAKSYLYKKIEKEITDRIHKGIYQIDQLIPGTKELAQEFQTSSVTVDRALSSLVERGYVVRKARKGTHVLPQESWDSKASHPGDIAIILHESPSPYFWSKALKGISSTIEQQQRNLIVGTHSGDFKETELYIRKLVDRNVSGLIYVPISLSNEEEYNRENGRIIKVAESCGLPYILFDRFINSSNASYVISNDYEASFTLTERLLDEGISHPLCLTHLYASSFTERERGFIDALKKRKIAHPEQRVYRINTSQNLVGQEHAEEIVEQIRQQHSDGIVAVNAEILIASLGSVNALLTESEKPYFVNFDEVGMFRDPRLLSSAVQDAFQHGKLVAELLLSLFDEWSNAQFRVVHPFELIKYQ